MWQKWFSNRANWQNVVKVVLKQDHLTNVAKAVLKQGHLANLAKVALKQDHLSNLANDMVLKLNKIKRWWSLIS